MNKYQRLIKRLIATAIKCFVVLAVVGGIYGAVSFYYDGVLKQKAEADTKLSEAESLRNNLRDQMDKTGAAEKKFFEFQGVRSTADFTANFEAFQTFLKDSKNRHRLSVELSQIKEVPTDKPELKNFSYDVMLRPKIELKVKAISDVHLFSFIRDMQRNAPGLVRVEKVVMKRPDNADLTDLAIGTLKTGASPLAVEATITLTWIRFVEKATKPSATTPPQATP